MSGFIEGSRYYANIPGHLFRDTRGRQYDRHSIIGGITTRVSAFVNTAPIVGVSEIDVFSQRRHAAPKVRRLRYMDSESRKQVVDFEDEPVSSKNYLSKQSDADVSGYMSFSKSTDLGTDGRMIYSAGDDRPTIEEELSQAIVAKEIEDSFVESESPDDSQARKLSEALKREREGRVTTGVNGYLDYVRRKLARAHRLAFRP